MHWASILSFYPYRSLAPALKVLSLKMHMNEYLAGVTILAFANSSPDLIANLMPIKENAALFTSIVSNALAILLLSGGMVCYLKPFKMDGHSTAQNLLFLLLSVELLRFIMVKGDSVTETESISKSLANNMTKYSYDHDWVAVLLSVYVAYLVVNVADLLLVRYSIRSKFHTPSHPVPLDSRQRRRNLRSFVGYTISFDSRG